MYCIEYAYELADKYAEKTKGYTIVNIERQSRYGVRLYALYYEKSPNIKYFKSIDELVEYLLGALLRKNNDVS